MYNSEPEFDNAMWQQISDADLGDALNVPSMLNAEEARFYFWLAAKQAVTLGSIVDLGCFAGGSTAYLAEGNRAGGGNACIYAYDQFKASEKAKQRQLYSKGVPHFDGRSILLLAKQLLSPWEPNITFRDGRIEDSIWSHGDISILVLDASKTAEVTDQTTQIFFPSLVPGKSIIVQQDELHWKEPWIAVQMDRLSDWFTPLCHVPGGTVAYRCIKKIELGDVIQNKVSQMTDLEMINALERSKSRLDKLNITEKLSRQQSAIRLNPGKRSASGFSNIAPR